jgi:hypothetical protein
MEWLKMTSSNELEFYYDDEDGFKELIESVQ